MAGPVTGGGLQSTPRPIDNRGYIGTCSGNKEQKLYHERQDDRGYLYGHLDHLSGTGDSQWPWTGDLSPGAHNTGCDRPCLRNSQVNHLWVVRWTDYHFWLGKGTDDCLWVEEVECQWVIQCIKQKRMWCLSFYMYDFPFSLQCLSTSLFSSLKGIIYFCITSQFPVDNILDMYDSHDYELVLVWGGVGRCPLGPAAWWCWDDVPRQLFTFNVYTVVVACSLSEACK